MITKNWTTVILAAWAASIPAGVNSMAPYLVGAIFNPSIAPHVVPALTAIISLGGAIYHLYQPVPK